MSNNGSGCGCTENNCPHRTSEVTLFDGTFTSIVVPAGAGLNEVLSLLENFVLTSSQCSDVNYTLTAFSSCLNLPAGTYSFNQIVDAIIGAVCSNSSDILALQNAADPIVDTDDVNLVNIVLPSCYSAFAGTTSTELFNEILSDLCTLLSESGPTIGDTVTVTPPDPGTQADPNGTNATAYNRNARLEHVAEAIKSIVDNNSFIYEHTAPTTSPTSFTVTINALRGVVENYVVTRRITEDLTVNASVNTYFYLSGDSTILRRETAPAAPAPATPTFSHPLYLMGSDGSGVTSVTNLYTGSALNPIALGANDVDTVNIVDGAVTSAKLATVIAGNTFGVPSLLELVVNDKGQVTTVTDNLNISGISNGQILVYKSGPNRFEKADNTNISSANVIPKANGAGTDYEDSSVSESTNQVRSIKKVEVNSGVPEDDSEAILNLVSTDKYFMLPRMTAAQAGALSLNDGAVIYVTSTDATFISVGFWGVESGAWTKL
jgi:hypothetical protein